MTDRHARMLTFGLLTVAAAIAALAVTLWLTHRHHTRYNCTSAGVYSGCKSPYR